MKTKNSRMRSIGIFALVFVLLTSMVLPLAASGSSDDLMGTYTVQEGDTLSSIAAAHGVTVASIVDNNGISASSKLYKGQKLLIPGASSVEDDSTTVFGSSSTISIDFEEGSNLIGVLETILAHTGYKMIYKGAEATVPAIALDNVTPLTAIDYVLRMVEMTYIKNDNLLYVGTADTLNSNFIDSKALTKFSLEYISTDTLTSQLSTLGITVSIVKVDINLREFWVSGYPMQLAKMAELIETLDNKNNITIGSASISSNLTAIELEHVTASEFSSLLGSLGLHTGITMAAHPMVLYVYATGDAYNDIMNIKKLVDYYDPNTDKGQAGTENENVADDNNASTNDGDIDAGNNAGAPNINNNVNNGNNLNNGSDNLGNNTDINNGMNNNVNNGVNNGMNNDGSMNGNTDNMTNNVVISDGETSLVRIDLAYINKEAAQSIISTFGYNVQVLGLDLYEKRLWLRGSADEVDEAVARIRENDIADNNTDRTFFVYELQNIVASELQSKIGFINIEGVEFYFGSYPQLTKSIMVYCATNKVEEVKEVIASLDNNLGDMYYPIATITDASELLVLAAKEELVVKLINNPTISVTSFELSGDLDPSDEGIKHILYVLESPENIDLILSMWSKI